MSAPMPESRRARIIAAIRSGYLTAAQVVERFGISSSLAHLLVNEAKATP